MESALASTTTRSTLPTVHVKMPTYLEMIVASKLMNVQTNHAKIMEHALALRMVSRAIVQLAIPAFYASTPAVCQTLA
jgi:hypothetical protein